MVFKKNKKKPREEEVSNRMKSKKKEIFIDKSMGTRHGQKPDPEQNEA